MGQNHVMAIRKTSEWAYALLHVAFYMVPFTLVFGLWRAPWAFLVMAGTHAVIDRYRLAGYWCRFWGVGSEGRLWARLEAGPLVRWRRWWWFHVTYPRLCAEDVAAFDAGKPGGAGPLPGPPGMRGPLPPAPEALAIWLPIVVDNTIHLVINHLSLAYLA